MVLTANRLSTGYRQLHTLSSASTTSSIEPLSSVLSIYGSGELPPTQTANTSPSADSSTAESDDKKKGNGGTTTKRTRHGLVTIKPNPTTSPTTESVKSTTTATTGVAQTTMASVEVIRGLGRQQGQRLGGKLMGMLRRRSISGGRTGGRPRPIEGLDKPVDDATENLPAKVPPTSAGVEGTVLGFTSYRKPPGYVPSSSVLVQVWAVGVDGVDGRLVGVNFGDHVWRESGGYEDEETGVETEWEREDRKGEESEEVVDVSSRSTPQQGTGLSGLGRSLSLKMSRPKKRGSIAPSQQDNQQQGRHGRRATTSITTEQQKLSRAFSLKRNNNVQSSPSQAQQPPQHHTLTKSSSQKQAQRHKMLQKATHRADVGYIPGRSFVGRVLECGWDVRDEEVRKGEWVVGLLDIKKVSFFWEVLFSVGFFCAEGQREGKASMYIKAGIYICPRLFDIDRRPYVFFSLIFFFFALFLHFIFIFSLLRGSERLRPLF